MGPLWNPKKPRIFESFTGTKMHSAEWDHSVDLTGKVVGVIGSGASAIQIIPAIFDQVKELHSFQRQPSWVGPKLFDYEYSKPVRWMYRHVPFMVNLDRSLIFCGLEMTNLAVTSSTVDRICKASRTFSQSILTSLVLE